MTATRLDLPPRARILVVVLRRLGDVLLATPLIRSLRRAWPEAKIAALVFAGTEGILSGNPDLDDVVIMPARPSIAQSLVLARQLFRRYDLAVSTQSGDRPTLFAILAGRRRVVLVDKETSGYWWKRHAGSVMVTADPSNHRVAELLRLAHAVGATERSDLVCPAGTVRTPEVPAKPYVVLHANPLFPFRRWTDNGWRALALGLDQRGFAIVATGGPGETERAYLDRVWGNAAPPVTRLDGRLDWPSLAALLRNAAVFVGPDTSVTHLAAGSGTPTVAIYGPASPIQMGPWPIGGLDGTWQATGTIQHRGNVWLVQNPLPCMPCDRLGCQNRLDSFSRCLDELAPAAVIGAVDAALAAGVRAEQADPAPPTATPI
jgi:heptosyltransferase-3